MHGDRHGYFLFDECEVHPSLTFIIRRGPVFQGETRRLGLLKPPRAARIHRGRDGRQENLSQVLGREYDGVAYLPSETNLLHPCLEIRPRLRPSALATCLALGRRIPLPPSDPLPAPEA